MRVPILDLGGTYCPQVTSFRTVGLACQPSSTLMYNPYNRNNCSLFWIPEQVWNPHYVGADGLTVWSIHTWVRDNRSLPSYQVLIRYSFPADKRGFRRATVHNIFVRSPRLEVWCQGRNLEGWELDQAKAEIRSRIMRLFNYKTLKGKPITRYRFNYIAAFPEGVLSGFKCHHEGAYNHKMKDLGIANGIEIPEFWLIATDDTVDNLSRKTAEEHEHIHYTNGDRGFFTFSATEYHISSTDESCEFGGEE